LESSEALCQAVTIRPIPKSSREDEGVGAYVGLTTRRHASGEIDWTRRISKCGDAHRLHQQAIAA
jgi:transposase